MKKLPEVIDLFSGCGGFSLGFKRAGFDITYGIDIDKYAVDTAAYNLDWRYGKETKHFCADVTTIDIEVFKDNIGDNGCIVIGGPPCQAYSKAGKAKLKSLGLDRESINDPRGYLFIDFIDIALKLDAKVVVMENVPDSTIYGNNNVPEIVSEILDHSGYNVFWTLLNAADYGVPQVRERVFVLAVKKDLGINLEIPEPTYFGLGNKGRPTTDFRRFCDFKYFRKPPINDSYNLWRTVGDAFSDLPELYVSSDHKYNQLPIAQKISYKSFPVNNFQYEMRHWFGTQNDQVSANCFRNTPRDFKIFERMEPGDDYESASLVADEIFEEHLRASGKRIQKNIHEQEKIRKKVIPPYDRSKFLTRWRRLDPIKPSHTVVAHLSVDTYSHIHPLEPRGISVREAARLQSFPDDFIYYGNMGEAFKQIGNAVPPLLSFSIAKSIKTILLSGRNNLD